MKRERAMKTEVTYPLWEDYNLKAGQGFIKRKSSITGRNVITVIIYE